MSGNTAPVSAFSVYKNQGTKRKNKNPSFSGFPSTKLKISDLQIDAKNKISIIQNSPKLKQQISTDDKVQKNVIKNKQKINTARAAGTIGNGVKKEKNQILKSKVKQTKQKRKRNIRINVDRQNKVEVEPTLIPIHNSTKYDSDDEVISTFKKTDPSLEGSKLFKWLISAVSPSEFFEKYWEKQVLHVQRNSKSYYSDILTTERLDHIFRKFPLFYSRNVDVVSYENGVKEEHNEVGRVVPSALYDFFNSGCSIRVLNPQTYDPKVHLLISTLQEYFGTMVGANTYLTPPGSQGFAPHFDDIEAFIIQLEGKKHWKLYKPKGSDLLARYSSPNFTHEEIGKPFKEVTLNAGDLLYFPRGTIHEGRTDPDQHSFHITVSVYQHNSYADLLEHAVPAALKKASSENLEFRKGLPLNFLKHGGIVNKGNKSKERKVIQEKVDNLMDYLKKHLDIDSAIDQLGRKFMYNSMPPVLSNEEANHTSRYDGDYMKDGKIYNRVEIDMDTEVRLIRYHCIHLAVEDNSPRIYYNTDNAKTYQGEDEQFLEIDELLVPCIEMLQKKYPQFITPENLPIQDDIGKMQLVSDLWERGLLVTSQPLQSTSDGEDEDEDSA